MISISTLPSLLKTYVLVPVLFVALMLRAALIVFVPGALDLIDDYSLGRLMAPFLFHASPFLFAGSVCLVRGRLSAGAWLVGLPLIGLTLLTAWSMAIAIRLLL